MHNFLQHIHLKDLVDICVVGLLIWGAIAWARRVHAILALVGLLFLWLFYLAAMQLELQLTAWFFQGFFAALVIFLVVVFQDDLRRLFERIAVLGLRRQNAPLDAGRTAVLIRALQELAKRRWGALVVLPRRDPLERHLQGGIILDAEPSEALLISLFDSHSPGHDGAVIWQEDRVTRFAVHLPLSENRQELGAGGTRHAAALGLAERCDAICLIVSEERGTISVASAGKLHTLDRPDSLREAIESHKPSVRYRATLQPRTILRGALEAFSSFCMALFAWLVLVPGAVEERADLKVPVTVENLPVEFDIASISPDSVEIEVLGARRELLMATDEHFTLVIDADLARLGRRTFAVTREHIQHETSLKILSLKQQKVRLSLYSRN